jgi:DNA-binding HxlR family transcriptional regulator
MSSKLKNGTTNACNIQVLYSSCNVNEVLRNISPRWKMQILHSIKHGNRQFSMLKRAFPTLSDQILGKRLSELVIDKLIDKIPINNTTPQQIAYMVTKSGEELLKIIDELHQWGLKQ